MDELLCLVHVNLFKMTLVHGLRLLANVKMECCCYRKGQNATMLTKSMNYIVSMQYNIA